MSFHAATIGQLLIVEAFVFFIWFRVLIWAIRNEPPNPQYRKLVATSSGLIVTSIATIGLMIIEAIRLYHGFEIENSIIVAYCFLVFGNFLFIVSASIETNWKQFKLFLVITSVWSLVYVVSNFI